MHRLLFFAFRLRNPSSTVLMALGPIVLGLGACTLPTNVAIKDIDKLRAEQTACLIRNAHQTDDRVSDPNTLAREIAMACGDTTERLVTKAIAKPNPQERQAFEEEAELRAAGYVRLARSASR